MGYNCNSDFNSKLKQGNSEKEHTFAIIFKSLFHASFILRKEKFKKENVPLNGFLLDFNWIVAVCKSYKFFARLDPLMFHSLLYI